MDTAVSEKYYTTDDIEALPEGERAELFDGRIYYMASPNTRHQRLVTKFTQAISNYIDSKNGDCEVFPAPFAVFINKDKHNYVEPDITVICDPEKITDKGCNGAPDWIIEVVSPSSRTMDYYRKLLKYQNSGVREYWIVDPEKEIVTVFNMPTEDMTEYNFGDEIPVNIYEGFSIKVEG